MTAVIKLCQVNFFDLQFQFNIGFLRAGLPYPPKSILKYICCVSFIYRKDAKLKTK